MNTYDLEQVAAAGPRHRLERGCSREAALPLPTRAARRVALNPAAIRQLQRLAGNQSLNTLLAEKEPSPVREVGAGRGSPLDSATPGLMGERLGHDFSDVRVHTGAEADESVQRTCCGMCADGGACERETGAVQLTKHTRWHVQRRPSRIDEESFAKTGGRFTEVGDTRPGSAGQGTLESNEFVLWNYHVARPELQSEHKAYLEGNVSPRWTALLKDHPDLHIKIIGSASSTGGAAITTPLSLARADHLKQFLAAKGIPAGRIVTTGVGSRRSFADETTPENMARNRRVETFLFRQMRKAAGAPGVSVSVKALTSTAPNEFRRDVQDPNLLTLTASAFHMDATVDVSGPPDVTVGILQFLRSDSRVGQYAGRGGRRFVLDYGRCVQPDLPCKDTFESMGIFSSVSQVHGPGHGTTTMQDNPGFIIPINITEPETATLVAAHWEMEFVAVLAARAGDALLPVRSVTWRVADDHERDSSGILNPKDSKANADPAIPGAPADLQVESAMSGRTCRFLIRRQHGKDNLCRPERA